MDRSALKNKLLCTVRQYRYAIIILAAGLFLMLLPSGKKEEIKEAEPASVRYETEELEDRLSKLLSYVQGAGKVKVLLTRSKGEQTVYQTDIQERDGSFSEDTVIVTGSDRSQQGLVCHQLAPQYLGAVIVCQGADKAVVRLAIVEAVSKATGLSTDAITVLKMK